MSKQKSNASPPSSSHDVSVPTEKKASPAPTKKQAESPKANQSTSILAAVDESLNPEKPPSPKKPTQASVLFVATGNAASNDAPLCIQRDSLIQVKCKRGNAESVENYRVLGLFSKYYDK